MSTRKKRKRDWEMYAVGEPSSNPKWESPDCCPFEDVYHICHVADAYRIFEDRKIRSSLVWDESKLRNTRTCVSWLSPDTWVSGSIYGNISFAFNCKKLMRDKRLYWVEAMTRYNPHAYRILVSEDGAKGLARYEPREGKGPIFYDATRDVWYRNGRFTGEFLFDGELRLSECLTVSLSIIMRATVTRTEATARIWVKGETKQERSCWLVSLPAF